MKLDTIDVKIIKLLRQDSKISTKKLAQILNLSRPTVKNRISRLIESGIIERFTVKINRKALVEGVHLFIKTSRITPELLSLEEVLKVYKVTGEMRYLLIARAKNMEEASRIIQEIEDIAGEIQVEIAIDVLKSSEPEPVLKADYTCEYCGSPTSEPLVFKYRNVEYFFCCPVCLKNFRRAIKASD